MRPGEARDLLGDIIEASEPSRDERRRTAEALVEQLRILADGLAYKTNARTGHGRETIVSIELRRAGGLVYVAGDEDGVTVWQSMNNRTQPALAYKRPLGEWAGPERAGISGIPEYEPAIDALARVVADMLRR